MVDAREVDDFDCGECFDVEFGCGGANGGEHVGVVGEWEPGMESADDVDFGGAVLLGIACFICDFFYGEFVSAIIIFFTVEGTELAGEGADIGVVEVFIDVVVGDVAVETAADLVGEGAD